MVPNEIMVESDLRIFETDIWIFIWGEFLVQRSIPGRAGAAEMGCKISLWDNDDPLFSAKTGITMGYIFKIFSDWCENRPNFINLIPKISEICLKA